MSVLECGRSGCENIMCDYVSYSYGYLCSECRAELISRGCTSIEGFMSSPKHITNYDNSSWEADVESEFKSRYEEDEWTC